MRRGIYGTYNNQYMYDPYMNPPPTVIINPMVPPEPNPYINQRYQQPQRSQQQQQ